MIIFNFLFLNLFVIVRLWDMGGCGWYGGGLDGTVGGIGCVDECGVMCGVLCVGVWLYVVWCVWCGMMCVV
jgi:hypothetical protein